MARLFEKERAQARKKAKELVAKMTLLEKASQLKYNAAQISRLGIPAYNYWNEALHGVARAGTATVFPQPIGMAASFDVRAVKNAGDIIAKEGRAKYNEASKHGDRDIYKGLTFWSPNINIFRDPRWGRGHETYGEDPYLTSRMGVNFVLGIQGEGGVMKAAACAKHFAAHSGPEALRHEFDAKVSMKDLWETYLPAFEALVKEAGVEAVMGAYSRVNGEPTCAHHYLMEEVLRGQWGFQGHYVSDCWALTDFHEHHKVTKNAGESAALAIERGCDLNCGVTYLHLVEAAKAGLIDESLITQSAERMMTVRYMLGLFDGSEYDHIPYEVVACKAHRKAAVDLAREGCVLLKNDYVLPLDLRHIRKLAVIGPNADSRRPLMGNYHGTAPGYVTILEGIRQAAGDDTDIFYSEGCHLFRDRVESLAGRQDRMAEALTAAEHSDAVILCVGLDETLEGEEGDAGNSYASGDKPSLKLPKVQEELIEKVAAAGKPTVVVLMTGSAVDLRMADQTCGAILQAWYPGAEGGSAVADILFGKVSPSGKLPVTFYMSDDDLPDFEDYSMRERTYRYMTKKPLYPFGYGLGYAQIDITEAQLVQQPVLGEDMEIEAVLKNSSEMEGSEVVQVYIKDLESPLAVPNYSLCAFEKICLRPGESGNVRLRISSDALKVVDTDSSKKMDSRHFRLYVGTSQPDERSIELTGKTPVQIDIHF